MYIYTLSSIYLLCYEHIITVSSEKLCPRKFQLYLRPHVRLFSPGFKVESVDESGHHQTHEINRNEYYHGYVGGEEQE